MTNHTTETAHKPYMVLRNGTIVERATGRRVGMVRLIRGEGWTGYLLGPDYPDDPWQQEKVDTGLAGRRWSVARAVWEADQMRTPPATEGGER